MIIISSAILGIVLYQLKGDYSIIAINIFITGVLAVFIIGGVILGISILLHPSVCLAFDLDGVFIEKRKRRIKWSAIKELYYCSQFDGDFHNNYLCVITKGNKKIEINIDSLNRSPEIIIRDAGMYFWNWKKGNGNL